MPRRFSIACLIAAGTLAACTPTAEVASDSNGALPAATGAPTPSGAPAPPAASEDADACSAGKVRDRWSNVMPSDDVKAAIAAAVGDRPIRYYADGDPITMDYSESRLNVVLGADGRIAEFRCG